MHYRTITMLECIPMTNPTYREKYKVKKSIGYKPLESNMLAFIYLTVYWYIDVSRISVGAEQDHVVNVRDLGISVRDAVALIAHSTIIMISE